jgi:hypothetical protein
MPAHPRPSVAVGGHGSQDQGMEIVFAILLLVFLGLIAQAIGADSRPDGSLRD